MLGNTGLQVSILSYGFWATFGVKDSLTDQAGIQEAKNLLTLCKQNGINLFDNAEVYGNPRGEAERIMGQAMAELRQEDPHTWRRSDCIITTKLFWGGDGVNEAGLSRKHLKEGMKEALIRLQVDYVDLVLCHRPDPYTPTETVVRGMSELVRTGHAHAWGTSEWSAQQITEAFWMARQYGLEPPTLEQPQYNLLSRERFEQEYHPLFKAPYRMGTTIWSPLASGILTGKYNQGIPPNSRMTQKGYEWLHGILERHQKEGTLERISRLDDYAQEHFQCRVSTLSIAWCLKNPNVSTVLLGATKQNQLEENLKALDVLPNLTQEHMDQIDVIMGTKPTAYQGYGGQGMRGFDTL
jgi:voltage-dependent potassium channel beta subunit